MDFTATVEEVASLIAGVSDGAADDSTATEGNRPVSSACRTAARRALLGALLFATRALARARPLELLLSSPQDGLDLVVGVLHHRLRGSMVPMPCSWVGRPWPTGGPAGPSRPRAAVPCCPRA